MIKETSGDRYEDARSLNQQLTFDVAAAYFQKKHVEFGEQQKRTLNIIGVDGTFSNLGMLLSDQCVHTIKMAVFDGDKKSIFRDRKELEQGRIIERGTHDQLIEKKGKYYQLYTGSPGYCEQ